MIANSYLNFDGKTEEAFNFYKSIFGGDFNDLLRYRDFGENGMGVEKNELDKIAHISLPLGEHHTLMGTDHVSSMPGKLISGNNYYITLEVDSAAEAERIFSALSKKGEIEIPLARTEWAEKYGQCRDRFGTQWMVMYTGSV